MNSLNILNDDRENRKILAKLPDYLVTRWETGTGNSKVEGFLHFVSFSLLLG